MTRAILILCLLACTAMLGGCMPKKIVSVVPEKPTAAEQFAYAYVHQKDVPPAEARALRAHYEERMLMYQKVVDRFPDDMQYTPEAILYIGRLMFGNQQYDASIAYFQNALEVYKDRHPQFESRAMLRIGLAMDKLKKYQDAKEVYQSCYEKYDDYEDPVVMATVARCKRMYDAYHIETGGQPDFSDTSSMRILDR